MTNLEERIIEFYDKYSEDYLYNPEALTDEEAQEFANDEGHDVYPFPYTMTEFEKMVEDYFCYSMELPSVFAIFRMVKDYQKPINPQRGE